MFVRFRKQPNGGFRPEAAHDDVVAWEWAGGPCECGERRRHSRRWTISRADIRLQPYRIKVTLVENTRSNGKVKQETVAVLGSIDATWLESFWQRMPDPALRRQDWEFHSLLTRTEFWQDVLERMNQIGGNRLSKEERIAIRRAIHKVVPWVMEAEKKRLELLDERRGFETMRLCHSGAERDIARDEETVRAIAERLPGLKTKAAEFAENMFHAGMRIAKLTP
jgi:hypothetical protein